MTDLLITFMCENENCRHSASLLERGKMYRCSKCGCNMLPERGSIISQTNESDNPDHYKTSKLECIDAMRAMLGDDGFAAYLRGTIFKYNWRLGRKDESVMEAKKIAVYTRWLGEVLAGKELSK